MSTQPGGVSEAGELLIDPTREAYEATLTAPGHRPVASARAAELGQDAGPIGALIWRRSNGHRPRRYQISELITSLLTVGSDPRNRRSAQRSASDC
jgi:hypothetical protein